MKKIVCFGLVILSVIIMFGCASNPTKAPEPLAPIIKHKFEARQNPPLQYETSKMEAANLEAQRLIELESQPKVTFDFPNMSLQDAFRALQSLIEDGQLNIIVADSVQGIVNLSLNEVPLEEALNMLCRPGGYSWTKIDFPGGYYYFVGSAEAGDPAALDLWVTEKIYTERPAATVAALLANPTFQPYITVVGSERKAEERFASRSTIRTPAETFQPLIEDPEIISHELVLAGPKPIVERIKKIIKTVVDPPLRQIAIQVLFTEAAFNQSRQIGIDWANGLDLSLTGQGNKSKNLSFGWQTNAMGELLTSIQAMAQKGELELRDYPRVVTVEGTKATIMLQSEERFRLDRTRNLNNQYTLYREQVQQVMYGVILAVVPIIKENGDIYLKIAIEVDSFDEVNADQLPIIKKRTATCEIMVASGETVVIGGLYQDLVRSGRAGIPVLSSLPIINIPMSMGNKAKEKKELTIFLTAEVLQPQYVGVVPTGTGSGSVSSQSATPEDISWWLRPIDEAKKQLNGMAAPSTGTDSEELKK